MPQRLAGRTAVVTAAGSGIGRASALRLAADGAAVVVNDISPQRAEQTAELVRDAGGRAYPLAGDMGEDADVRALVSAAMREFGRLDVLHNNAGISVNARVGDTTDKDWRLQQRVVLDSVFYGIRAALPHMIAAGGGSIVNTSSGAGIGGEYGLGAYGANKAGVLNLTRTVALEYAREGIRCNAITPGPTATPPLLAWLESVPGGPEEFTRNALLCRLSTPEEVAEIVAWLACDESSLVSGECISGNYRVSSPRP